LISIDAQQYNLENNATEKFIKIYSNLFAPLLCVGKRGFSYAIATNIATTQYPPHPDWPPNIQTLSSLWHGDCTGTAIDALYNDTFWLDFVQNGSFPPAKRMVYFFYSANLCAQFFYSNRKYHIVQG
jgi:hypothetical protein